MRAKQFLDTLGRNLFVDYRQIEYFSTNGGFRGGWETWLQASIGYSLRGLNNYYFTREPYYAIEDGHNNEYYLTYDSQNNTSEVVNNRARAAKADFLIERTVNTSSDTTYFELKVLNSSINKREALDNFIGDVKKISTLYETANNANWALNCVAMVGFYGTLTEEDVEYLDDSPLNGEFSHTYLMGFSNRLSGDGSTDLEPAKSASSVGSNSLESIIENKPFMVPGINKLGGNNRLIMLAVGV